MNDIGEHPNCRCTMEPIIFHMASDKRTRSISYCGIVGLKKHQQAMAWRDVNCDECKKKAEETPKFRTKKYRKLFG